MTTPNTDQDTATTDQQTSKRSWIMPAIAAFFAMTTIALGTFALAATAGADPMTAAPVELSTTTTSATIPETVFVDTDDADADTPSPAFAEKDGVSEEAPDAEPVSPESEPVDTAPEPEAQTPDPVAPPTEPVAVSIPKGLFPKLEVPDSIQLDDNNKGMVTVHNGGGLDLTVTSIGSDFAGVTFYGVIGTLTGGETKGFNVVINEETLPFGDYTIDVLIQSTAGDKVVKVHGTKTIPIFLIDLFPDFPPDDLYI